MTFTKSNDSWNVKQALGLHCTQWWRRGRKLRYTNWVKTTF